MHRNLIWEQPTNNTLRCHICSETEMEEIGIQIASQLVAGDVVALIGGLGAGKTRLVKAIAKCCGVPDDEVNSPTFTLIQEYPGQVTIRHCDTYRLKQIEEFADLGLDELFAVDGIAFVEWADRVEEYLPRDRLVVQITIDGPDSRTIDLISTGNRSSEILTKLKRKPDESGARKPPSV